MWSIFHRIVGLRNKRGWRSLFQPLAQHWANLKGLVQSVFKYLQGWRLHSLSGPLVQGCTVLRRNIVFFVSNGNFPCWTLSPSPPRGAWLCLLSNPIRAVQPDAHLKPFLSAGWTKLPQHLFVCVLQTPDQLQWPPLDSLVQVPLHNSLAFQRIDSPPQTGGSQGHLLEICRCLRINAETSPLDGGKQNTCLTFLFIDELFTTCANAKVNFFFLFLLCFPFLFNQWWYSGCSVWSKTLKARGSSSSSFNLSYSESRKPFSPLFCTQLRDSNFIWRYFQILFQLFWNLITPLDTTSRRDLGVRIFLSYIR